MANWKSRTRRIWISAPAMSCTVQPRSVISEYFSIGGGKISSNLDAMHMLVMPKSCSCGGSICRAERKRSK